MHDYIEVKRLFADFLGVGNADRIDEDADLIVSFNARRGPSGIEQEQLVIENDWMRDKYEQMLLYQEEDLQMYSENSYEVAVSSNWIRLFHDGVLVDSENEITYCIQSASIEFILMLCNKMLEDNHAKDEMFRTARMHQHHIFRDDMSKENYISRVFRISTLRIRGIRVLKLSTFQSYCSAYEYIFMYNTRRPLVKVSNLTDLYERNGGGRGRAKLFDEPPRRTVNTETLDYYAMAVAAADPFTAYISFYHVLEYYFDEVYKQKLVEEMQNRITAPDFSYKNSAKLYELAKWIGNRMRNDEEIGRGNELDSLKYVLEEYAPIEKLTAALNEWDVTLVDYYCQNSVSFAGSKKDKIGWKDVDGVYTNLANRIYSTRNALVHSKSEQLNKQYKPQKHKNILKKELPLIQVISELVIFANGKLL